MDQEAQLKLQARRERIRITRQQNAKSALLSIGVPVDGKFEDFTHEQKMALVDLLRRWKWFKYPPDPFHGRTRLFYEKLQQDAKST